MGKLVIFKFSEGNFQTGFSITLQIGDEYDGAAGRIVYYPSAEVTGKLPDNLELLYGYQHWQSLYRQLGLRMRLGAPSNAVTKVSLLNDCEVASQFVGDRLNAWLQSNSFRRVREKWLEQLSQTDSIRVIVQTEDPWLRRLPWHLWEMFERYPKAELALSSPSFDRVMQADTGDRVNILAILGNSQGIDISHDQAILEQLPNANIQFLVEPERETLNDYLWSDSWDVLFFAGHSSSQHNLDTAAESGCIFINPNDSLSVQQLRFALRYSVDQGLKLAIFNSCDGLGLARELADLKIPQLVVMREPIPDRIAQTFLRHFLTNFSSGKSLYLSVRQARERLQALEDQYPCATWLPVLCQNPAIAPPSWNSLSGQYPEPVNPSFPPIPTTRSPQSTPQIRSRQPLIRILSSSLMIASIILGIRYLGWLQPLELWAYDHMMRLRPAETPDDRILIVTIDDEAWQDYGASQITADGQRVSASLSFQNLNQLLTTLELQQPALIGLDILQNYDLDLTDSHQYSLANRYRSSENLIVICQSSNPEDNVVSVAAPSEIPDIYVGFNNAPLDGSKIIRRQILTMNQQELASPCQSIHSFNFRLAIQYLQNQGYITEPQFNDHDIVLGTIHLPLVRSRMGAYQGVDAGGRQMLLNYRNANTPAQVVSLRDILDGRVNRSAIEDKIVLIGVTAQAAGDYWPTPFGSDFGDDLPGIMIQAHMISQILSAVLDNRPLLWTFSHWVDSLIILGWTVTGSAIAWWICPIPRLCVVIIGNIVVIVGGSFLFFTYLGLWLPVLPSVLSLGFAFGATRAALPTIH